jgi:SAM-dependent methyltransferase
MVNGTTEILMSTIASPARDLTRAHGADVRKESWEQSYARGENHIFYPKEETVKFLNRFIRRRTGVNRFQEILTPAGGRRLRGLDYGCGIGRMTVLLEEFGIDGYGVDISETSIRVARDLAEQSGYPKLRERLATVDGTSLPFENDFFDFSFSEGCLDSMRFNIAQTLVRELHRVTRKYCYVSLISGDNSEHWREFAGDEVVTTDIERDTVQSYFNHARILELIADTTFEIRFARLITEESLTSRFKHGRYHVVLAKPE